MRRLLYISTTTRPIPQPEIETLLRISRRNNTAVGVSGLLVTGGRRFLQALEGEEAAVEATFNRIGTDPRHRAVVVLTRESITQRSFGNWAMGHRPGAEVLGSGSLAELIAPISDPQLRSYFEGFAEFHAAA